MKIIFVLSEFVCERRKILAFHVPKDRDQTLREEASTVEISGFQSSKTFQKMNQSQNCRMFLKPC